MAAGELDRITSKGRERVPVDLRAVRRHPLPGLTARPLPQNNRIPTSHSTPLRCDCFAGEVARQKNPRRPGVTLVEIEQMRIKEGSLFAATRTLQIGCPNIELVDVRGPTAVEWVSGVGNS